MERDHFDNIGRNDRIILKEISWVDWTAFSCLGPEQVAAPILTSVSV